MCNVFPLYARGFNFHFSNFQNCHFTETCVFCIDNEGQGWTALQDFFFLLFTFTFTFYFSLSLLLFTFHFSKLSSVLTTRAGGGLHRRMGRRQTTEDQWSGRGVGRRGRKSIDGFSLSLLCYFHFFQ